MSTVEPEKGLYEIKPFSVGYIDGQNKAIIMLSVIAMIAELDPWKLFYGKLSFYIHDIETEIMLSFNLDLNH